MVSHRVAHAGFAALLCAVFLASCSSAAPSPSPEDTFEPLPSAGAITVKILIPNNIPSDIQYKDVMDRLNALMKTDGQNVQFELRSVTYNSNGNTYLTKAREELAAGNPAADAYAMSFDESETFFNDRLTMDVTALVRQNAPTYYSRYGNVFNDVLSGIPVGVYNKPVWFKTAMVLRKDYLDAGSAVRTMDALFAFLDSDPMATKNYKCVLAEPWVLINQWALEQGYYPLGRFGVNGYLYAAINDTRCTPILLESLPGFEAFMEKMMSYYTDGVLGNNFYTIYNREPIGFVKELSDYYVSNPFSWLGWIPGEFTAQLFSPELPSIFSDPSYVNELAIPASVPQANAAEVARFVEWYNSSQENYDAVLYGEPGTDFSAAGGRFAPLKAGQAQNMKNILQMQGLFFNWPGASLLSNTDYFRLPASAPANLEGLYDEARKTGTRFEASRFFTADRESYEAMAKLSPSASGIVNARNEALNSLIFAAPIAYTKGTYDTCMESLAKVRTDMLVAEYQRLIDGFRTDANKQ